MTTTPEDRQTIARILLDRVVIAVEDESEHVDVEVRFAGGFVSQIRHSRPVQTYDQRSDYEALIHRVQELQAGGETLAEIATSLNAAGFVPAKRSKQFNRGIISGLLRREKHRNNDPVIRLGDASSLCEDEWWLSDLAAHLKMPIATMHRWRKVGWVSARKVESVGGHWAIHADASELTRLNELRRYRCGWGEQKTPSRLTTPRAKDR